MYWQSWVKNYAKEVLQMKGEVDVVNPWRVGKVLHSVTLKDWQTGDDKH